MEKDVSTTTDVKVEYLSDSYDDADNVELLVKQETLSESDDTSDLIDETQVESPSISTCNNIPSNNFTDEPSKWIKCEVTENSTSSKTQEGDKTFTSILEDKVKTEFSQCNSLLRDSVKTENDSNVTGADVKVEIEISKDEYELQDIQDCDVESASFESQVIHSTERGKGFTDDQSDKPINEGPVLEIDFAGCVEGNFPCTKCYLCFSSGILLDRHQYKYHYEECWRKRIEMGGSSNLTVDEDLNPSVIHNYSLLTDKEQITHTCSVCRRVFDGSNELERHMRTHTKLLKCTLCDRAFGARIHLKRHLKTVHSGKKPFQCTLCDKAFSTKGGLTRHMIVHNQEKSYKCIVCDKAYASSERLRIHMRTHSGEKRYKCNVCDKSFGESGSLQRHMRIHNGEKPFKCTLCDKAFAERSNYIRHERQHNGDKPYSCFLCQKSFFRKHDLERHMKVHKGYECKLCYKLYGTYEGLQRHVNILHGKITDVKTLSESVKSTIKMQITERRKEKSTSIQDSYVCGVCTKEFTEKSSLELHMRIHDFEKPYQCTICNKTFRSSSVLNRHTNNHKAGRI